MTFDEVFDSFRELAEAANLDIDGDLVSWHVLPHKLEESRPGLPEALQRCAEKMKSYKEKVSLH